MSRKIIVTREETRTKTTMVTHCVGWLSGKMITMTAVFSFKESASSVSKERKERNTKTCPPLTPFYALGHGILSAELSGNFVLDTMKGLQARASVP